MFQNLSMPAAAILQAVFDSDLQGIVLLDEQRIIRAANGRANEWARVLFGEPFQEALAADVYFPDDEVRMFRDHAGRALAGVGSLRRHRLRSLDGQDHFFDVDFLPVTNGNGEVVGLCLGLLRVDAAAAAPAGTLPHSERLTLVARHSADAVLVLDAQGVIRDTSPSIRKILGYGATELAGQRSVELVHPDDMLGWRLLVLKGLPPFGSSHTFQTRFRHADRSWRHLETMAHNRLDDPTVKGIVINLRDVTHQVQLQESWRRYEFIVDTAREHMSLIDPDFRVAAANRSYCRALGRERGQVVGRTLDELWGETVFAERIRPLIERGFSGDEVIDHGGFTFPALGDRYMEIGYYPYRDGEGQVTHVVVVAHDETEGRRSREALRESEERYALAVTGANDGLWDWDLRTGRIYFSPRWKRQIGCREIDISARPGEWLHRVHPEDLAALRHAVKKHLRGGAPHFQAEYRLRHRDGSYRWMLSRGMAVRDDAGRPYRMAGSQSDITYRKQAEEQLLHDAFHDALTGLPNRALFRDRLNQVLGRFKRPTRRMAAVMCLDLDRFQRINDTFGHRVGDRLLVEVGRRLSAFLRPTDTVARLGGDEYAIILDELNDTPDGSRIARRIQQEIGRPFDLDGREVVTSGCLGVVTFSDDALGADELLRQADTALSRAKIQGPGSQAIYDPLMHQRAAHLLNLEMDFRHALERQEFRLYYQPIIALATGRLAGFEALIRWVHPRRGIVMPGDFIALAEETGLITGMGEWVIAEACRQLRQWQDEAGPGADAFLSVNISGRQFRQRDLAVRVAGQLERWGIEARKLKLEITESEVMGDAETAMGILRELRELNLQLSIDDFGTGYSSLSYLPRFPVDTLKIDRSFVSDMQPGNENALIVRAVVDLARNLNLHVVAEGVETEAQREMLRSIGCEFAQGFLFARPLDVGQVPELIRDLTGS